MNNHYRNGDWSIQKVDQEFINKHLGKTEELKHNGTFTFAEGEATGHYHKAVVKEKENMSFSRMPDGSYLVSFKEEATITHPEHSEKVDLKIPIGDYIFYKRREKDWLSLSTRKVID